MPYGEYFAIETLEPNAGYSIDNTGCMITVHNDVQFMGNVSFPYYNAGAVIMVLPEDCRPYGKMLLPVCVQTLNGIEVCPMQITAAGEVSLDKTYAMGVLFLRGVTYNNAGLYYNSEYGNNYERWGDDYGEVEEEE